MCWSRPNIEKIRNKNNVSDVSCDLISRKNKRNESKNYFPQFPSTRSSSTLTPDHFYVRFFDFPFFFTVSSSCHVVHHHLPHLSQSAHLRSPQLLWLLSLTPQLIIMKVSSEMLGVGCGGWIYNPFHRLMHPQERYKKNTQQF